MFAGLGRALKFARVHVKSYGMYGVTQPISDQRVQVEPMGAFSSRCASLESSFARRIQQLKARLQSLFRKPLVTHSRGGMGASVVYHLAAGWGRRQAPWRVDMVALGAEAYGQLNCGQMAFGDVRLDWTTFQLLRRLGFSGRIGPQEDEGLVRLAESILEFDIRIGDRHVPEAVLFLRGLILGVDGAVGLGPERAVLMEAMTWLGLAMELEGGGMSPEAWSGSFTSLGLPVPSRVEARLARQNAVRIFGMLDGTSAVALTDFARHPFGKMGVRRFSMWRPHAVPTDVAGAPLGLSLPNFEGATDRWVDGIQAELAGLLRAEGRAFSDAGLYLLLQGGKRVRPLVVLGAAWACGGHPESAQEEAALVELLHQSSLVLDDIADQSEMRRLCQTVHRATSEPFALGFSAWMLARLLLAPAGRAPAVRERLAECAKSLVEGQRSEWVQAGRFDLPVTEYYRMIQLKTGQLFASAAELGGVAATATVAHRKRLRGFGKELGLLFQIVDDVLDYSGRTDVLGKEVGLDFRSGKVTLPLLLLWKRLDLSEQARLQDGGSEDPCKRLEWVQERMEHYGVSEDCRERARRHGARARQHLKGLPGKEGVAFLMTLLDTMEARVR